MEEQALTEGWGHRLDGRAASGSVAVMDAICPEGTVLRIEAGGGALLFADSLVYRGNETGVVAEG